MKKVARFFMIWVVTGLTVANLLIAMAVNLNAARCESGDGAKCEGDCCYATKTRCVAGPCDVIFK